MGRFRKFFGETAVYGVASGISRSFAFFLIPIYTHYLTPENYANLIILQLIFTISSYFLTLTSGVFYYYYENEKEKYKKIVFSSWLYYQKAIILFAVTILLFLFPYLTSLFTLYNGQLFGTSELFVSFFVMMIQLLPFSINMTNINLYRIQRRPSVVVKIVVTESALTLGLVWLFTIEMNLGLIGIVFGQLAAKSTVSITLLSAGFWEYYKITYFSKKMMIRLLGYSWPYFIVSIFNWLSISADKFLGTQLLSEKTYVAILGFASQIVVPLVVVTDVVRQAIGPYIMSIRKKSGAKDEYSALLTITMLISTISAIMLIGFSPFLVDILATPTYYPVLIIIPFLATGVTLKMAEMQFGVGLNLRKKNSYIAISQVFAGVLAFFVNFLLLSDERLWVVGLAQILANGISTFMIFQFSKKFYKISYELNWLIFFFSILGLTSLFIFIGIMRGIDVYKVCVGISSLSLIVIIPIGIFKLIKLNAYKG